MISRIVIIAAVLASLALAQSPRAADPTIAAEVARIRTVDNHAHTPKLLAAGEKDEEWDALPCSGHVESTPDPLAARSDENPLYRAAWKALWGADNGQQAAAARAKKRAELGDKYPAWVLDQQGTEIMLSNRVAMGTNGDLRGLTTPRFRWVPYADALMYPLNNSLAAANPDRKFFYGREEMLLKRYATDSGVNALPATLADYTAKVLSPTIARWKQQGAVAIKFEAAYLRALDFAAANESDAAPVYAKYVGRGVPSAADDKTLQDFLFHSLAAEAGKQGLAVHIHTGIGCGSYFYVNGSDPALLDGVLNDPTLRKTNFVLVHGGWPFHKSAAFLLAKPNVYADFSNQDLFLSRDKEADVLRDYLEWYPEKLIFGTDLFPGGPELDWEEIGWGAGRNGGDALALTLTDMVAAGEITHERALELARLVLRENAMKLYGFGAAK